MKPSLTPLYLQLIHRLAQRSFPRRSEAGFTLLESLMAILVIALVIGVIATPLLVTVSTRNNNRKTEQALQVAQALIEKSRVALGNWDGLTDNSDIPQAEVSTALNRADNDPINPSTYDNDLAINAIGVPTGTPCGLTPSNTCPSATALAPYDRDGDGTPDFYVQVFRVDYTNSDTDAVQGFDMGVRVYPVDTVDSDTGNVRSDLTLSTEPSQTGFTTNVNDPSRPYVALYTSLYRSDNGVTLVSLNADLGVPTPTSSSSTSATATPAGATPATSPSVAPGLSPTLYPTPFSPTPTPSISPSPSPTTTVTATATVTTSPTATVTTSPTATATVTTSPTTTTSPSSSPANIPPVTGTSTVCVSNNAGTISFNVLTGVTSVSAGSIHKQTSVATTDSNGDTLTLESRSLSGSGTISSGATSNPITITGATTNNNAGTVTFTVSDGRGGTATGTWKFEVRSNSDNCPP